MPSAQQYRRTEGIAKAAAMNGIAFAQFFRLPFWARMRWLLFGAQQPKAKPTFVQQLQAERKGRGSLCFDCGRREPRRASCEKKDCVYQA